MSDNQRFLVPFRVLEVGRHFSLNGYRWRKNSSVTAQIVSPEQWAHHWRWFSKSESVVITAGNGA